MAALGMVKETLVFLMARSEGYLGSKIDQKTHLRNQNQVHRVATSYLTGETVGFCADAHAGPVWSRSGLRPLRQETNNNLTAVFCPYTTGPPRTQAHSASTP